MLKLHRFTESNLEQAGEIALALWGPELPRTDERTKRLIYRYLPRYYYFADSPFSLGISDDGELLGMLLAHPRSATPNHSREWLESRIDGEDRSMLRDYHAYLDGNRAKELSAVRPGEVILDLFASRRKGCGRILMDEFSRVCRTARVPSMLLWTDDTCDFSYYYHNRFEEVSHQPTAPTIDGLKLTTYLFRKAF